MSTYVLPFEKTIVELEKKLEELRSFSEDQDLDISSEITKLETKLESKGPRGTTKARRSKRTTDRLI